MDICYNVHTSYKTFCRIIDITSRHPESKAIKTRLGSSGRLSKAMDANMGSFIGEAFKACDTHRFQVSCEII